MGSGGNDWQDREEREETDWKNRRSDSTPPNPKIEALEAKCAELKGLYDSEYNNTQALRSRVAWLEGLVERAKEFTVPYHMADVKTWLSDLEAGPDKKLDFSINSRNTITKE